MSKPGQEQPDTVQTAPGWRIKAGFVLFIIGLFIIPLLLAVLALTGLSGATLSCDQQAAGAAIAGKKGYAYIKSTVFGYLKKYGPPRSVSRSRYLFGLVLFLVPQLFGWALPYFGEKIPGYSAQPLTYTVISDLMLFSSLFVLGGDFWDKLRSLFLFNAKAIFPDK